jgi:small GTP-binding protein
MAHTISRDALARLAASPSHTRNICILAHVDHGKTTLTDGLLSSNGIISPKMAGRVRYMDSTEEEQARGITMKSSAIALLHADEPARELRGARGSAALLPVPQPPPSSDAAAAPPAPTHVPYLVNLIDSPGHVDFSVDVATAARLCDGALVIVDAVEGVCIQTHAVLRTAWAEGVRPALVLNKVDRLITELQLSPTEAYSHLCRILEQVNVIMSSLYTADLLAGLGKASAASAAAATDAAVARSSAAASSAAHAAHAGDGSGEEEKELTIDGGGDGAASSSSTASASSAEGAPPPSSSSSSFDAWAIDIDEKTEASLFFDPTRGNVVFASAYDGWAFSVDDFARLHAERLGVPRALLRRALWGEFYYRPKTKKIVTGQAAISAGKGRNIAVSLMLEPLWAAYDALVVNPNDDRIAKIVSSLKLEVSKRDLAAGSAQQQGGNGAGGFGGGGGKDAKIARLQAVMRAWLPLHTAVLGMVVRALPSPFEAQRKRLPKLWPSLQLGDAGAADAAVSLAAPGVIPPLRPGMTLAERIARVRASIEACSTDEDAECVVFVSKMFAVPKESLPDQDAAYLPFLPSEEGAGAAPAPRARAGAGNASLAAAAAHFLPLPARAATDLHGVFPTTLEAPSLLDWDGMRPEAVGTNPPGSKMDLTPVTHPGKRVSATGIGGGRGSGGEDGAGAGPSSSSSSSSSSFGDDVGEDPNSVETFVAFARVFSGVLRADRPVFVLGPKYDPRSPEADGCAHISRATRTLPLFLMMGRDLCPIPFAYAGNIVGIGRLGGHVLKTATLSTSPATPSLTPMTFQTTPLVRVAIEPANPTDLPAVERGLALLNQADPCVEVTAADNGELQLAALGELHLQRCVKDLTQRFACVELRVSPPILSFLETVSETAEPVTAPSAAFPAAAAVAPASAAASATGSAGYPAGAGAGVDGASGGGGEDGAGSVGAASAGGADGGAPGGESSSSSAGSSSSSSGSLQTAFPGGGGPTFPFSWSPLEFGVAFHPPTGVVIANTSDRAACLRVRAVPLPPSITTFLQQHAAQLRSLASEEQRNASGEGAASAAAAAVSGDSHSSSSLLSFVAQLRSVFVEAGAEWADDFTRILAFGPKKVGPNLLVCRATGILAGGADAGAAGPGAGGSALGSLWRSLGLERAALGLAADAPLPSSPAGAAAVPSPTYAAAVATLRSALPQGFQLATSAGPLCGEPVWGVCFVVEDIAVKGAPSAAAAAAAAAAATADAAAPLAGVATAVVPLSTGQLISVVRDASRVAFEAGAPRLVEAFYRCELQCSGGRGGGGEALGKCYGVLSKRRGRVLAEDLFEGTETFVITALLPVVESFGFADDLRKKTSGAATSPQLLFDHWEVLPENPFFQPTTKEEREAHGDTLHEGQMKNLARTYMDAVRTRKGMQVERKLVVHADKQRNLSRKK